MLYCNFSLCYINYLRLSLSYISDIRISITTLATDKVTDKINFENKDSNDQ